MRALFGTPGGLRSAWRVDEPWGLFGAGAGAIAADAATVPGVRVPDLSSGELLYSPDCLCHRTPTADFVDPILQPPISAALWNRPLSPLRAAGVPRKPFASATQSPALAWANSTQAV